MKSLRDQLNELAEAVSLGTVNFSDWEEGFMVSVYDQCKGDTTKLSEKQVEKLDDIYRKYF